MSTQTSVTNPATPHLARHSEDSQSAIYRRLPKSLLDRRIWLGTKLSPDPTRPDDPHKSIKPPRSLKTFRNMDVYSDEVDVNLLVSYAEAKAALDAGLVDLIGIWVAPDLVVWDFDKAIIDDGEYLPSAPLAEFRKKFPTYFELSQSRTGAHLVYECDPAWKQGVGKKIVANINKETGEKIEGFLRDGWVALTADCGGEFAEVHKLSRAEFDAQCAWLAGLSKAKTDAQVAANYALRPSTTELLSLANPDDDSAHVLQLICALAYDTRLDQKASELLFKTSAIYNNPASKWSLQNENKWEREAERCWEKAFVKIQPLIAKQLEKKTASIEIDASTWREQCKSVGQLSSKVHPFVIQGLVPRAALTFISAPSYNAKTWFALQMCQAASEGKDWFGFGGPRDEDGRPQSVPVIYHVPEMAEYLVRERAEMLSIKDDDNFLFRAMECGLWPLDDSRMIASAAGRLVVLDTVGYFNPADDASSYQQAIKFANLVHNLLQNGAISVIGLCHPPKYASTRDKSGNEPEWTLENSVIGSAGYGGLLRSCLRVKNLTSDLNDANIWLYVQGMKNPGLKPFQLEGAPLKMKVAPGDSPYLKDLVRKDEDPRQTLIREYARADRGVRETHRALVAKFGKKKTSLGTVQKAYKQEQKEYELELQLENISSFAIERQPAL
jgi:hypothetical protein